MDEVIPDVFRILPTKVTPSKYVSIFVRRESGNVLFPCFSSHSTIDSSVQEIRDAGGIAAQLLGDMHFATNYNDSIFDEFGVPLLCSEIEAPDVQRKVKNVETFPFERHELLDGVEVIPTPGHRDGAVGYLLSLNGLVHLFIGDTLWHDGDNWRFFVNKKNRKKMQTTLELLHTIHFDVLLSNTSVTNPICHTQFKGKEREVLIQALIESI